MLLHIVDRGTNIHLHGTNGRKYTQVTYCAHCKLRGFASPPQRQNVVFGSVGTPLDRAPVV